MAMPSKTTKLGTGVEMFSKLPVKNISSSLNKGNLESDSMSGYLI